ncbi:MAG: hypothetical protein JWP75_4135 [Frondihabitans sp.]|nr:hypothetical protein [Frondihabitans sp.]
MTVLGIDLAAGAKSTCACVLESRESALRATVFARCDDNALLELAQGRRKVAIDAPFGWPNEFVDALNAHRSAEAWPAPEHGSPETYRASLSFRATDRVVMQTRRPLSVSTDKLGVTAMRCAFLLHRWSTGESVDRTGRGKFVEVYPAGALVRWGLGGSGYKGANHAVLDDRLDAVLQALPALELSAEHRALCASSHDAFDALVAALVARAALLGLTDSPPLARRKQAKEEGWIHLPLRGSLPFLARDKPANTSSPAHALAENLAVAGVELTPNGYATRFKDAVLAEFSATTRDAIQADLVGKGGSELAARAAGTPKFHAAHSSAALAANVFGPFLDKRNGIPLGEDYFTGETHLEVECATGLRGTPPTLDCLVDGPRVLAVESKCTETFGAHAAGFSEAYTNAMASAHPTWRAEYHRLRDDPNRYRHLDAAQLIKHYVGLRNGFPGRPLVLAYLYWTPTNSDDIAACCIHLAELAEFSTHVNDPNLQFIAMSYRELWADWASPDRPTWLRRHVASLRRRYDVAV